MARTKKTIISKKEVKENVKTRIKNVKAVTDENKPMQEQLNAKKEKKKKENVILSYKEYEQLLTKDMSYFSKKNQMYIEQIAKLEGQLKVANIKFRTKYMQLAHEKQTYQESKQKLMDIITRLKIELIKYSPDHELYDVADTITKISNSKHIANKTSVKMPK